ncbi:protein CBFA2T1 [Lepeophtheirus salmonis]|nr:protein CBFA2T3-like [Lepeophtheirus salmonis]XP_040572569.1 protein CBFA2T3-like [Lepeophtheirus salmonis]
MPNNNSISGGGGNTSGQVSNNNPLPLKGIIKTEEPSSPPHLGNESPKNNGEQHILGLNGSENNFMMADSASGNPFPSSKNKVDDREMLKNNEPLRIGLTKPTTAFHTRTSTPTATQRVSPRLGSPGLYNESFPLDLAEHRILYKIKRFLSTLVQFGTEINVETGDKVKELIFNLVASTISINEFHQVLQEVTNFPLRPFVLPFLKSNMPLLIRDVSRIWASFTNEEMVPPKSLLQYIRSQPNLIFDLQGSQSSAEINDIFNSEANLYATNSGRKRRGSSSSSVDESNDLLSPLKRACKSGPSHRRQQHWVYPQQQQWRPTDGFSMHSMNNNGNLSTNNSNNSGNSNAGNSGASNTATIQSNNCEADDEWKNIYVMLNCILGMVEKTKRALSILQQRNITNNKPHQYSHSLSGMTRSNFSNSSLYNNSSNSSNGNPSVNNNNTMEVLGRYHPYYSQPVGDFLANTLRNTEDRVVEVRRRAEEAVNEVKRIALSELQRVVCFDERRPMESVVPGERIKTEKLISEQGLLRNKVGFFINPDEPKLDKDDADGSTSMSRSNCWNCGRSASETCSGCNQARYCSQFCQLKDWESHHRVCGLKTGLSNIMKQSSEEANIRTIITETEELGNGGSSPTNIPSKSVKNEKNRGDENESKKIEERKNNKSP